MPEKGYRVVIRDTNSTGDLKEDPLIFFLWD